MTRSGKSSSVFPRRCRGVLKTRPSAVAAISRANKQTMPTGSVLHSLIHSFKNLYYVNLRKVGYSIGSEALMMKIMALSQLSRSQQKQFHHNRNSFRNTYNPKLYETPTSII